MERLDDAREGTSLVPPTSGPKVEILPGAAADGSACTFCIHHEDHTLGNALRWMIMKNPDVEFCGYSAPHPSEPKIHVRVQMYDGKSATEAVRKALDNLEIVFKAIESRYQADLDMGDFDASETEVLTHEKVRAMKIQAKKQQAEDVVMAA